MDSRCLTCQSKTIDKIIEKTGPQTEEISLFKSEADFILANAKSLSAPYLSLLIHRLAKKVLGNKDLYQKEKAQANNLLLSHYNYWLDRAMKAEQPLFVSAKLAVLGNIIDYGAHSVPDDILKEIGHLMDQPLVLDDRECLMEELKKAKSVLYLGDNCGEIVFDKLFIELLQHPNLTFVVRGEPVINDVVMEDAIDVGMNQLCKVISNGHDAPSTLLDNCTEELQSLFKTADVIISKGMGNLEGLLDEKRDNIFFMLMAKCDYIADKLGVAKGDLVITKNRK